MKTHERAAVEAFFSEAGERGASNSERVAKPHRTIRRVQSNTTTRLMA